MHLRGSKLKFPAAEGRDSLALRVLYASLAGQVQDSQQLPCGAKSNPGNSP